MCLYFFPFQPKVKQIMIMNFIYNVPVPVRKMSSKCSTALHGFITLLPLLRCRYLTLSSKTAVIKVSICWPSSRRRRRDSVGRTLSDQTPTLGIVVKFVSRHYSILSLCVCVRCKAEAAFVCVCVWVVDLKLCVCVCVWEREREV